MQTKIFDGGGHKKCYIDEQDFRKKIENNELTIEKEYPNEKIKRCTDGVDYELMTENDWIIEVREGVRCMGQEHRYQIHCNFGRFPSEPIATYEKAFRGRNGEWRYRENLIEGVEYEENGGSANLYTNDKNGEWRKMMTDAGFKVIDVND